MKKWPITFKYNSCKATFFNETLCNGWGVREGRERGTGEGRERSGQSGVRGRKKRKEEVGKEAVDERAWKQQQREKEREQLFFSIILFLFLFFSSFFFFSFFFVLTSTCLIKFFRSMR